MLFHLLKLTSCRSCARLKHDLLGIDQLMLTFTNSVVPPSSLLAKFPRCFWSANSPNRHNKCKFCLAQLGTNIQLNRCPAAIDAVKYQFQADAVRLHTQQNKRRNRAPTSGDESIATTEDVAALRAAATLSGKRSNTVSVRCAFGTHKRAVGRVATPCTARTQNPPQLVCRHIVRRRQATCVQPLEGARRQADSMCLLCGL